MPAPTAAAVPAHFFRRKAICFFLRRDGGLGVGTSGKPVTFIQLLRHQRCSLRARCQRGGTDCAQGEFEKIPTFHDVVLLVFKARDATEISVRPHERALKRAFRLNDFVACGFPMWMKSEAISTRESRHAVPSSIQSLLSLRQLLTSNSDGGASSGGANDGDGGASPNIGGDANPNGVRGTSRDGVHGPSRARVPTALLQA